MYLFHVSGDVNETFISDSMQSPMEHQYYMGEVPVCQYFSNFQRLFPPRFDRNKLYYHLTQTLFSKS